MSDEAVRKAIALLAEGRDLPSDLAEAAFTTIMEGGASEGQIGAFLMGLRAKGETIGEIAAGVRVMCAKMTRVEAPADAMDCCGTGGDARGTYNISTAVSFILAGAGLKIAKHGNRSLSSKSGAAEVLAELGVKIDVPGAVISRAITEAGVGFMMAPLHHGAMKHVGPVRQTLGIRTIFNLLGPLSNPAGVRRQLIGVFSAQWVEPIAHALKELGAERAWVVHGDGLDELTTAGTSFVAEVHDGAVRCFEIDPEEAGLPRAQPKDLVGGTPHENMQALKALLGGAKGPYRDIVLLNAAGALIVAGKADTLKEGAGLAAEILDSGRAQGALDKLVAITNG